MSTSIPYSNSSWTSGARNRNIWKLNIPIVSGEPTQESVILFKDFNTFDIPKSANLNSAFVKS